MKNLLKFTNEKVDVVNLTGFQEKESLHIDSHFFSNNVYT